MDDSFNNIGDHFGDFALFEPECYIQSINQHDPGCQTSSLPLHLYLCSSLQDNLFLGHQSSNTHSFQDGAWQQTGTQYNGMTWAQIAAPQQPTPHTTYSNTTNVQPQPDFPAIIPVVKTTPTIRTVYQTAPKTTYAQIAQRSNQIPPRQHQAPTTPLHPTQGQSPFLPGQYSLTDQIPADYTPANQASPRPTYANPTIASQRQGQVQRRPSRAYHTSFTNEVLQDLSQSLTNAIPVIIQPEVNQDPRNISTLVQRTRRGGHRQSFSSSTGGTSIPSSPAPPGTFSASSSRSRRKGEAMRDPTLPFPCHICGKTFRTQEDHKRHLIRSHGDKQDRPHKCTHPGCDKAFVHPKDLRRHQLTHGPQSTFDCPHYDCDKVFTRQDNLNRHVRDYHPVDSAYAPFGSSRDSSRRGSFTAWQSF